MPENEPVPLVYYQCVQKLISIRDAQYVFTIRHNISLSYVEPKHVDAVLNVRGGCGGCGGGRKKNVFRRATDQEIRIWNGETSR